MANTVLGPRVPGSAHIPFNPINKWGGKPKVFRADGSVIDWKSPIREPLFQVHVDTREGSIPIGPRIGLAIASEIAATTQVAIKAGRIHGWANPTVVPA
jgi:hypothetical protein